MARGLFVWNHRECRDVRYLNDSEEIMADDKSKRGPQDRSRISLGEDYEVRYWSEKFGVSADQLKAAVKKVGNSADAVEKELRAA
jgi:hypothetical protein